MTREEAVEVLKERYLTCVGIGLDNHANRVNEAIDMAIETLSSDAEQGEWIEEGEYAECSMCGAHSGTQFDGVEPIPLKTNYCPNCGARMKGGAE